MAAPGIRADAAPAPVGTYPHARRVGPAGGPALLLLSGIGPRDPATGAVPGNVHDADGRLLAYDIQAQARAALANVRAVLEAGGARWQDLVDVTVYLTDMGDFAAFNAIWAAHFPDPSTAPCRTTLGIDALPTPIAIELKCMAALDPAASATARSPAHAAATPAGAAPPSQSARQEQAMIPAPLDFNRWIQDNRHLLKPPVGNKCIYDGDFIVMVVGGPNARTDYHFEEGPEWFYQLEGEMTLRIQEGGAVRDIPIRAGETFLLPPRVPHSPQRGEGSIGLVIERRRLPHEQDGLLWFCERCNAKVYEEYFHLRDIEQDFFRVFETFYRDDALRTCKACGHLNPRPTRYELQADSQADIT